MRRALILSLLLLIGGLISPYGSNSQTQKINGNVVIVGNINWCADTGSAGTYVCTLSQPITSYRTGTYYRFQANSTSTNTPATLNLNGLGAKTIKKTKGNITTDLVAGDICTGQMVEVMYDGTNMQMTSPLCQQDVQSFTIVIGTDDATSVLLNSNLGPQRNLYTLVRNATIQQISVYADAGTPNVIVHRRSGTTDTNMLTAALQTAAAGGLACAKTTATAGFEGTTCSATLTNAAVSAGQTIGLTSGTAGGVAKRMSIMVFFTYN